MSLTALFPLKFDMLALATKAATRVLNEDVQKAAHMSGVEAVEAAQNSIQQRRLPSAITFALRAAEKKHPEAHDSLGEALLELGLLTLAEAVFALGSATSLHNAVGRARVLAELHRPASDVRGACEAARRLHTTPGKNLLQLARVQAVSGQPDEAYESLRLAMEGLELGDPALNSATTLAASMEFEMYAEAAWPQSAATRPERRQDKEKADGADIATWRLQRGIETARMHCQRVPQCISAAVLAAEMLLEAQLYQEMLIPRALQAAAQQTNGMSGVGGGDDVNGSSTCAEQEEIRALMLMAGVPDSKLGTAHACVACWNPPGSVGGEPLAAVSSP